MAIVKKILFPTEFQDLSLVVARQLGTLSAAGLEEVVFLFVIDRDRVSFDLARGFDEELADRMQADAEARFGDWAKQLAAVGVKARHRIELGRPSVEILRTARDEDVDMIVTSSPRGGGGRGVYLGGTSMDVIRDSEFPVYVAKPIGDDRSADDRLTNPFVRVVLATDFSEASARAAKLVKSLAPIVDEVDVLNVMSDRDPDPSDEQAALDAIAADLGGIGEVRTHVRRGRPTVEILRVRDDHDATVIVMGTTGRHGIKEVFLGSCSHRVAEASHVPVVLVPGAGG